MTPTPPVVLELPAMLHGSTSAVRRAVAATGQEWAREYLETRKFTQPQRMRQVPPGEVLEMLSGSMLDVIPRPRWRFHMFISVFMHLNEGIPEEEYRRARESFELFCLNTPWGALYHAVTPPLPRSTEFMSRRFAALLRFWDVLQGPRYVFTLPDVQHTLEELIDSIYCDTLNAWCPAGPDSVREHLNLTAERMARATQEECVEAVLKVIPSVMRVNADFQNRALLNDPVFQRERLAALLPKDFEDVSSADGYAVNRMLYAWDRALGRR